MSASRHLDAALAAEADAYRLLLAGEDGRPSLLAGRDAYLASHEEVAAGSWGRLLGALKLSILADDGVEPLARRALAEVGDAGSPASAYVRALAQAALGEPPESGEMRGAGGAFEPTARALEAIGAGDRAAYEEALRELVADFERRDAFLSGVPIADTALVLQALAERRGIAARLESPLLP